MNHLKSLIVSAPEELHAELRGRTSDAPVAYGAKLTATFVIADRLRWLIEVLASRGLGSGILAVSLTNGLPFVKAPQTFTTNTATRPDTARRHHDAHCSSDTRRSSSGPIPEMAPFTRLADGGQRRPATGRPPGSV